VNLAIASLPCRQLSALAVVMLATTAALGGAPANSEEATRVRFLIVADSDAKEGAACAFDGRNLKAVLEAGLGRQKLDGRYTIDVITGRDVAPGRVAKYYQDLKVGPNEALVFYYSGHGAYHATKGHLLTFMQGDLPRSSVLAAMQRHKPRLAVVLTDCCAVYDGSAPAAPKQPGKPAQRSLVEPADGPSSGLAHPPRPKDYLPPSAKPKGTTAAIAHPPRPANYRPSPPFVPHPDDNMPGAANLVLRTATGALPVKTLLAQTNGEVLRHLFFRHTGVVDINACEKGKAAFATTRWGGGVFTITLLSLQKDPAAHHDANRNGIVEWSEFFATLRMHCNHNASVLTKGAIRQLPHANRLAQPGLQIAGR
jgi:hypothetical protein